jgi:hypothetical protein
VSARDVNDTPILSLHPAICSEPSLDFHYDFSVIASLAYEVSTLYREIEKKELSNAALRSIKDVTSSLQQQEQRDGASTSGSETTEDSATSSFTESASDGAASNDINAGETTFFSSATQCSAETKFSEIASIGQVMALSSTPRYVVQLPAIGNDAHRPVCSPSRLLVSSSSPYQILQVNAAFHRFSKAFSFLGKTASDLTTDQNLSTALAKAGSERRPFKARIEQFQWENSQPTTVSVYPVGTHKGSVITHFAVEVDAGEEAPATGSTYSSPQDTQAAVPGHVVVTG